MCVINRNAASLVVKF